MTDRDSAWLGRYGERVAASWLRAGGCRVLARNHQSYRGGRRAGEVDIVARQGGLLLFIEVKTRRGNPLVRPLWAVDRSKQQLIERAANDWLRRLPSRNLPWRFDVIEVYLREGERPQVKHIENVF